MPLYTVTTRRALPATAVSHATNSTSWQAESRPKPPGTTTVSTATVGSGRGAVTKARPVPVWISLPPEETTLTA